MFPYIYSLYLFLISIPYIYSLYLFLISYIAYSNQSYRMFSLTKKGVLLPQNVYYIHSI